MSNIVLFAARVYRVVMEINQDCLLASGAVHAVHIITPAGMLRFHATQHVLVENSPCHFFWHFCTQLWLRHSMCFVMTTVSGMVQGKKPSDRNPDLRENMQKIQKAVISLMARSSIVAR
jgi:hypothetical protein